MFVTSSFLKQIRDLPQEEFEQLTNIIDICADKRVALVEELNIKPEEKDWQFYLQCGKCGEGFSIIKKRTEDAYWLCVPEEFSYLIKQSNLPRAICIMSQLHQSKTELRLLRNQLAGLGVVS